MKLKTLKAIAKYRWQLSNLVAFIRLNLFVQIDLQKWMDEPFESSPTKTVIEKRGILFPEILI